VEAAVSGACDSVGSLDTQTPLPASLTRSEAQLKGSIAMHPLGCVDEAADVALSDIGLDRLQDESRGPYACGSAGDR